MITPEQLKRQLSYDPETGVFHWAVNKYRVRAGDVAGRPVFGYICIKVNQKSYPAHRLAWLYMTGAWPENQIDHRDRDRTNNRWSNLRAATNKQNHENLPMVKTNTSGVRGVRWDKDRNRWFAYITHNQKMKNLGRYETKEEAIKARLKAEDELFTHHVRAA